MNAMKTHTESHKYVTREKEEKTPMKYLKYPSFSHRFSPPGFPLLSENNFQNNPKFLSLWHLSNPDNQTAPTTKKTELLVFVSLG